MKQKLLLSVFALFLSATAWADIEINETNFPDENFRNYLLEQDYGTDGVLTEEDIAGITSINVSSKSVQSLKGIELFTALGRLYCDNNQLTTLDVSGLTALNYLNCYGNQLTTLNVSGCTALKRLYCYQNKISGAGMDALVESLPTISKGEMRVIDYENEQNDITGLQVNTANAKGWIPYIHVNRSSWYQYAGSGGIDVNEENFPDVNFRNWVLYLCEDNDGKLSYSSISIIKEIYVNNLQIQSLKGIEYFTALNYLECAGNQLTALDMSKNTALKSLYCYNNQLTSLDISNNTNLAYLDCSGNQLTEIDLSGRTKLVRLSCDNNPLVKLNVSGCTALDYLSLCNSQLTMLDASGCTDMFKLACYNNKLTSLDVSGCTQLSELSCYNNKLTSLDVSGCTQLYNLYCYQNQIKGEEMDALLESLPNKRDGKMYVIYTEDEQNVMTSNQVVAAKAKGWKPQYYNNGSWHVYIITEPVSGGLIINEENFPDGNFQNWLLIQSFGRDEVLTADEIAGITDIFASGKGIQNLKGIEYFTALKVLNCYDNQLASLDLSNNTNLTSLECGSNQLTELDVSRNIALTSLECGSNLLTELDVSRNTALTDLGCHENQLTMLDISKNTALVTLWCHKNRLTSLDVSGCAVLSRLSCFGNLLPVLDVSKNTALTELRCNNNRLTALDVSQNTALTTLVCFQNNINGERMDALVESLPTVNSCVMYVIYNENERNIMTTTQVEVANAKGWLVDYFNGVRWDVYSGSEPDPDGIVSPLGETEDETAWYDLSGRRVVYPGKGLYIKNGKKVMVK